jgi:arrestin-related trafficking adapter 4/5/7
MPLDESGNLLDQTPGSVQSLDLETHAPPLYGEHILDQLYGDIEHSAAQSGMNTPAHNRSRSGSQEDLGTIDGIVGTEVGLDALSSRLQNLNSSNPTTSGIGSFFRRHNGFSSGGNTPLHHGHGSTSSMQHALSRPFDHDNSVPRSNPRSRRTSDEQHTGSALTSGRQSPEHIDFSDIDLSKVPSYTTAIRQPARGLSYSDAQALPNYEAAISAPPSPELAHSNTATTVRPGENEVSWNAG